MPRQNKKQMKRHAAQAVSHLMDAANNLYVLKEIFLPHHPQYAEFFEFTIGGIGIMIGQLAKVFTLAWGYFPEDLDKWKH